MRHTITSPCKYLKESYVNRTINCKENKAPLKNNLSTKKKKLSLNNWRIGTECPEKQDERVILTETLPRRENLHAEVLSAALKPQISKEKFLKIINGYEALLDKAQQRRF